MKSTTPTIEPKEPQMCGNNMKTFSILLSMWSLFCGISIFTLYMSENVIIYGNIFTISMLGVLPIIAAVIYLGVGFTDNPMWSKVARIVEYIYTVRSVCIIGYMSWLLNSAEMLEATVKSRYDYFKENDAAFRQDSYKKYYKDQVAVFRQIIITYSLCIIVYIYLSIKYGENAEYLKKKADKESAVIIDI